MEPRPKTASDLPKLDASHAGRKRARSQKQQDADEAGAVAAAAKVQRGEEAAAKAEAKLAKEAAAAPPPGRRLGSFTVPFEPLTAGSEGAWPGRPGCPGCCSGPSPRLASGLAQLFHAPHTDMHLPPGALALQSTSSSVRAVGHASWRAAR